MNSRIKMTGVTLIIIGIISLSAGIYLYSKPVDKTIRTSLTEDAIIANSVADSENASLAERLCNTNQHLEKIIEMAIADGSLTSNERKLIEKLAIESGEKPEEVHEYIEACLAASTEKPETAIIDQYKKSGDDFEKFIVKKFDKKYYKVKEWAGDKYIEGIYAETTLQPDLVMELNLEYSSATFAVECKWRSRVIGNGLNVATKEQLERYKAYGEEKNMPVFMAIGLGGEGAAPKHLFIVPIQKVTEDYMNIKTLYRYKHSNGNLFFDIKTRELR
jgi:energy-converting hydrogenase Eha subunit C